MLTNSYSSTTPFLWGAATSAHQVEGNNTANDWWALENSNTPVLIEPSGDAVDQLHRWPQDLDLLASLGLNSYRWSLEWSRIEPERGRLSRAYIDHYRRVVTGCLERGLTPLLTLHHVTVPAWFRRSGGWDQAEAVNLFARYVENVLPIINEGVQWVCTINEPNLQPLMTKLHTGDERALNVWHGGPMPETTDEEAERLIELHRAAREVVRGGSAARAGWSVAVSPPWGADARALELGREWFDAHEGRFLRAAAEDDYVGVQNYTRAKFDHSGPVKPGTEDRMTQIWEYYPEALGDAVRVVKSYVGDTPIIVTENGLPTTNDDERIEFIKRALVSLHGAMAEGIDVRGYIHWSAFDNFEWALGYKPRFGLIEVDPETFERRVKASARFFGEHARAHAFHVPTAVPQVVR